MPRKLVSEERKVWKRVTRTVSPRRRPHGKKAAKPLPLSGPSREDFANMLRVPPSAAAKPKPITQSLDLRGDKKTRRGQVHIDTKVDLHDMTQSQARPALHRAVMRASNRNYKCVLVITGKGVRLDGVLRRNLPIWLEDPVIRPLIASYAQAHIRHGGSGAWYVFLKA